MIAVLYLVIFAHVSLFGAGVPDEDLPGRAQEHIRAQVGAYKNQATINLRDDLDLWALLVFNKICGKKENEKPLGWVLDQKENISSQIITTDLERPKKKLEQLRDKLGTFYDAALADVMVSKEGTISFILANPGEVLGTLLEADPEGVRSKVEKLVTDTFFPDDEIDEELAGGADGGETDE